MNTTELDRLVIAYREDPTEENRAALMAEQRAYHAAFIREEIEDYQRRTH